MIRSRSITLFLLFGLAGAVSADILVPGTKWVGHHVRFENLADFPDYVFFLKNCGFRGQPDEKVKDAEQRVDLRPLTPDSEESLSGNPIDGPKWLFAVPKKLYPDTMQKARAIWFDGDQPDVLKIELMHGRRSAPISEKRGMFLTIYRIGIKDGKLDATVTRDDQPGAGEEAVAPGESKPAAENDEPGLQRVFIGGAIAVVALALGLFVYFRKKG